MLGIVWAVPDVLGLSYWLRFAVAVASMIAGVICVVIACSTRLRRARAAEAINKHRKEKTEIYEIKDVDLSSPAILEAFGAYRVLFNAVMRDENRLSGVHSYVVIARPGNEPFIIELDLALNIKSDNSLVGIYMMASHEGLRDALVKGGLVDEESK